MTARCMACGVLRNWRATRGAKLAEAQCQCGGRYELTTLHIDRGDPFNLAKYVHIGRKTGLTGHWPARGTA